MKLPMIMIHDRCADTDLIVDGFDPVFTFGPVFIEMKNPGRRFISDTDVQFQNILYSSNREWIASSVYLISGSNFSVSP